MVEDNQIYSDQDLSELEQEAMTSHDRVDLLIKQSNITPGDTTSSRVRKTEALGNSTSLQPVVCCGPAAQGCEPGSYCGPARAEEPPHIKSEENSMKVTADDLARMFVRCRESPGPPAEDKYDGDPKTYHRFIRQVEDRIMQIYGHTDPGHALQLLTAATRGRAHRIVDNHMMNPSAKNALADALLDLKVAFGSPLRTVNALLEQIRKGSVIRTTADGLEDLYIELMTVRQGMLAAGAEEDLNATSTVEAVFWRFPTELRKRFVRFAFDRGYRYERVPFDEVLAFIERCKLEASSTFGRLLEATHSSERGNIQGKKFAKGRVKSAQIHAVHLQNTNAVKTDNKSPNKEPRSDQYESKVCECGKPARHALWKCSRFKELAVEERWAITKSQRHCFNCLASGHLSKNCKSKQRCLQCGGVHHSLLHRQREAKEDNDNNDMKDNAQPVVNAVLPVLANDEVTTAQVTSRVRSRTRLKVLPVRVTNMQTRTYQDVFALLDCGSDTHLVSKDLYDALALNGKPVCSRLCMADGNTRISDTYETSFEVRGINETESFVLTDVHVVNKLSDLRTSMPKEIDFEHYPHLSDIDMPIIERDKVDLLIGLNYRLLHEIVEKRDAGEDELCAGRSVLGWFLYGRDKFADNENVQKLTCHLVNTDCRVNNDVLNIMTPYLGGERHCPTCSKTIDCVDTGIRAPSIDDDRAMKIIKDTCTLKDGHYEIGLPWSSDDPELPNNYTIALSRLKGLGKRLKEDSDLLDKYNQKIYEMLKLGYAAEINTVKSDDSKQRVWYIPHHHVRAEKFRVVFDASSRFAGVSLNDRLLQGPSNTNTLLGVLSRFRLHKFAFVADIKAMFYQVRVAPADRYALRFLYWLDGNPEKFVKTYEMCVHPFGLTSSPSVAGYALLRTAEDNRLHFTKEAYLAVTQNFYVDDLLKSCKTVESAVALIKELDLLLNCGGFQLMKFASNHPAILEGLSKDRLSPQLVDVDLQFDNIPAQKTLGLSWNPSIDSFCVVAANNDYPLTRRGLLSFLSRWYDPLGIVAPYLLPAKLILQRLAQMNLEWDDANLPYNEKMRWLKWEKGLCKLDGITVPRCFCEFTDAETVQLHCFADAS